MPRYFSLLATIEETVRSSFNPGKSRVLICSGRALLETVDFY